MIIVAIKSLIVLGAVLFLVLFLVKFFQKFRKTIANTVPVERTAKKVHRPKADKIKTKPMDGQKPVYTHCVVYMFEGTGYWRKKNKYTTLRGAEIALKAIQSNNNDKTQYRVVPYFGGKGFKDKN